MINVLAVGTAVLSLVAPPVAVDRASDVPPGAVTVSVASVNGTGCPHGSATVAMSRDKRAFTVSYSEYTAVAGPGVSLADGRKNCQINMRVNVPGGYTYGIQTVDYRGYADVKRGAVGSIGATYYFSNLDDTTINHPIQGPMEENWHRRDEVPFEQIVWNPCGDLRQFNIKTQLDLNKGSSTQESILTMDSTDVGLNTVYQMAYKKC